jgi:TonB family protein
MRTAMALRRDDPWARRVVQMVGLSTAAHVAIFAAVALFGAWLATRRPEPVIAYSVELTDLPGTGGRLPAGPGNNVIGRSPEPAGKPKAAAAPPAAATPPAPPPPPAPPVAAAPVTPPVETAPPPKPPEPKPAEVAPKPVAKVAPKPTPKKAEVKKPEPKKVEAKKVEPKPVEAAKTPPKPAEPAAKAAAEPPKSAPPPATATPAPEAKPAPPAATAAEPKPGTTQDAYANAAQRFRDRMAAVGTGAGAPGEGTAGGGPGGGVLGSGGDGRGGGQVKSLEWVAYKQRIVNMVKERWSNAIKRPGLMATVRFKIARDGTISAVQVAKASGNAIYDQTAVAAVERVRQLPPPPAAYADEFADFEINFHGDEMGGVS